MIGENIKRHRILKGLSLRKFGELVGLSQTAIAKYENNILEPDGEKRLTISDREYKIIRDEYNISIKAIISCLKAYGIITSNYSKLAFINYNKLYKDAEINNVDKQNEIPRKYEQLVLRLYSQNLITQSRFNELM